MAASKTNAKDMGLFGDVAFEEARTRTSRPKVEVPEEVLETLRQSQALGKRAMWPVRDETHLEAMRNVFYSAGDLLEASVLGAPVAKVDGAWKVVKDVADATHVRVTVGAKRGRKAKEVA